MIAGWLPKGPDGWTIFRRPLVKQLTDSRITRKYSTNWRRLYLADDETANDDDNDINLGQSLRNLESSSTNVITS